MPDKTTDKDSDAPSDSDADSLTDAAPPESGDDQPPSAKAPDETSDALARLETDIDRLKRALADADNARKRAEKSAAQAQRLGIAVLARDILPLADSLTRALAAGGGDAGSAQGAGALADGVKVMARDLAAILARHGIEAFDPGGERFDPHRHEALSVVPGSGLPDETIIEVVQAGYVMDGRLLRPAQVIVARQPSGKAASDSPGSPDSPDGPPDEKEGSGGGEDPDLQAGDGTPI